MVPAMSTAVSPLAPTQIPDMPEIPGVRLATAEAGIRYAGRHDVLMVVVDPGTNVAGVFTRSRCPSAPVDWCRQALKGGRARAVLVNSGNANAFTGRLGEDSSAAIAEATRKGDADGAAAHGVQRIMIKWQIENVLIVVQVILNYGLDFILHAKIVVIRIM